VSADIAAVNIDKLREEIKALRNEIARLGNQTNWVCKCGGTDTEGQRENEEQARLLGKGAEREARLLGRIGELQQENAALKTALDHQMNYQRELRADKDRLDWLDKTGCWLTITGQKNFISGSARAVIDAEMGVKE
jgi:hypothetical protein